MNTYNSFNRFYLGDGNYVYGSLSVDGVPVQVARFELNPAYDQVAFDASDVCTDDLAATISPY